MPNEAKGRCMKRKISVATVLQMAGYETISGHCNELKCYAIYAYNPEKSTIKYIAKRRLGGSYQLYDDKGALIYTLKSTECGSVITKMIKTLKAKKNQRLITMDNFEFGILCEKIGLKSKDLQKIFNVPKKETSKWIDEDKSCEIYDIPESVIVTIKQMLKRSDELQTLIVKIVEKTNTRKVFLIKYRTEKALLEEMPELISINYYNNILQAAFINLEKLGYKCETKEQPTSFNSKKYKDACIILPKSLKN